MTSDYLLKPIRGRLELVRDISVKAGPAFRLESVFTTAKELSVTVFALHREPNGNLLIDAVSDNVCLLIGHTTESISGRSPDSLLSQVAKADPFKANSTTLGPGQDATCFPVFEHKNGTKLECIMMLIRRLTPDAESQNSFIALVIRAPNSDLVGGPPES